jgi:hypothetical protein
LSRREKQSDRLRVLQRELQSTLRSHLEEVANGFNTHFFGAERFCGIYPNAYLTRHRRPIETIVSLGDEILKLCEQLNEEPCAMVVALHHAREEEGDYSNAHRLGPIRLARRLLAEIEQAAR